MLVFPHKPRLEWFAIVLFTIITFLSISVYCDKYQIPIPGGEMASDDIEDVFVPVYCLTKLSKAEEEHMEAALVKDDDETDPLPWVKPRLVPWTGDKEGNADDLYRLYREMRDDTDQWRSEFFFFLDRQCVEETKVIIADPDGAVLLYRSENMNELNDLIKKHGAKIPEMSEGVAEELTFELLDRALTYGRVPASAFRSIWANLDIGNMGMAEMVEMYEGKVELYHNPDWDVEAFLRKAEEANKKFEKEEKQNVGAQEEL